VSTVGKPIIIYYEQAIQSVLNDFFVIRKPARANQLYMPEAASPLMWIGRTQGQVRVKVTSETVRLSVAVSRPGAYSLAQGLQLDAMPVNKVSSTGQQQSLNTVLSPKMEFTLIVDHDENA